MGQGEPIEKAIVIMMRCTGVLNVDPTESSIDAFNEDLSRSSRIRTTDAPHTTA